MQSHFIDALSAPKNDSASSGAGAAVGTGAEAGGMSGPATAPVSMLSQAVVGTVIAVSTVLGALLVAGVVVGAYASYVSKMSSLEDGDDIREQSVRRSTALPQLPLPPPPPPSPTQQLFPSASIDAANMAVAAAASAAVAALKRAHQPSPLVLASVEGGAAPPLGLTASTSSLTRQRKRTVLGTPSATTVVVAASPHG